MIARASGFGMGLGRFSRPVRGLEVIAIPDAGQDTTRCFEFVCDVSPGVCVLPLFIPGVGVGVFIDRRCVADVVEVTRQVISATRDMFNKDQGMEF